MAIYSLEATPVGGARGGARATATDWCAYVERELGYAEKGGHIASFVLLPDSAPEAWHDPHALWAAVDAKEGAAGHVATEYCVSLARELTFDQSVEAVRAWCAPHVEAGRCVHVAIHESPAEPGLLHAHVTETVRGLDKNGKWVNKRETYYPLRRDGEEIIIPAAYWKQAKAEGWEKIYPFKDGVNRTKTEAIAEGLSWREDRKSQKPLQEDARTNNWGSKSTLYLYRETWAAELNKALGKYAPGADRVDHRSYIDRNIDQVPQLKQGFFVTQAEREERERCQREGVKYQPVTAVGQINADIGRINEHLRDEAVPVEQRQELLECGYELHALGFARAEQVREHTRPMFEQVREQLRRAIEEVRRIVERVLSLPICRTARIYARELMDRGVMLGRDRGDYTYTRGGYAFAGAQLGERYTKRGVEEALRERTRQRREIAREAHRKTAQRSLELDVGRVLSREERGVDTATETELNRKGIANKHREASQRSFAEIEREMTAASRDRSDHRHREGQEEAGFAKGDDERAYRQRERQALAEAEAWQRQYDRQQARYLPDASVQRRIEEAQKDAQRAVDQYRGAYESARDELADARSQLDNAGMFGRKRAYERVEKAERVLAGTEKHWSDLNAELTEKRQAVSDLATAKLTYSQTQSLMNRHQAKIEEHMRALSPEQARRLRETLRSRAPECVDAIEKLERSNAQWRARQERARSAPDRGIER